MIRIPFTSRGQEPPFCTSVSSKASGHIEKNKIQLTPFWKYTEVYTYIWSLFQILLSAGNIQLTDISQDFILMR
jgi:hypothetical protein